MKLIIEKLFNPLSTYSIYKNNLIKFRESIYNSGHCAMSFYLVWDSPREKMMGGMRFSMRESIGVRSMKVLSNNNLKWQFLITSFLPRATTTFSFILVAVIEVEIRQKWNTLWNAQEINSNERHCRNERTRVLMDPNIGE